VYIQRLGRLVMAVTLPLAVLRFVGVQPLLDVGTAVLQQARDQTCQLMCRGRDAFGVRGALSSVRKKAPGTLGSGANSARRGAGPR